MTGTPLGRVVVLTDRRQAAAAGHGLVELAEAVSRAGADTILLREKDLPADERHRLATAVAEAVRPSAAQLVVASDAALARAVGAAGVHLGSSEPTVAADDLLVGRSCHDAEEIGRAVAEGLDLVTVSPIHVSASKPGYGPALGPAHAAALVDGRLPAYALGGIGPEHVEACLALGFAGVALMGAVNRADDPGRVVAEVVDRARAIVGTS